MATKRVCDRCGAEINPPNSVTYAGMRRVKTDINDSDYELCVSCAHELRKWFTGDGYYGRCPHQTNTLVHGYEKSCGLFDARKVGGGDG